MIWSTGATCNTSSALYTFCSGQHDVFEHNVELSNYQSVWPYEYRWAKWPEAYLSNSPDRKYLDTSGGHRAERAPGAWCVGAAGRRGHSTPRDRGSPHVRGGPFNVLAVRRNLLHLELGR